MGHLETELLPPQTPSSAGNHRRKLLCAVLLILFRHGDRNISCLQALVCNNTLNMTKVVSEKQVEVMEI